MATYLLAKIGQLFFVQPALDEGPGVDTRRTVALEVDHVGAELRLSKDANLNYIESLSLHQEFAQLLDMLEFRHLAGPDGRRQLQ